MQQQQVSDTHTVGKIQLKISPSLATMLDTKGTDWLTFEKEIEGETTIGDFLADFAASYTKFRKVVFDPDTGKVSDQLDIVLNDSFLPFPDVMEAKLADGDSIILLPTYTGG
ncbi:MoaD/ThiS family protein [Chloroflexota bacterium]